MRTVHDLEQAFTDLADLAPDADVLTVPAGPARRRPRRILAPVAAVLVTVAVVGGAVALTGRGDDRAPAAATLQPLRPPAAAGSADTTFRFTANAPAGSATVRSYAVDRGGQRLEFQLPSGRKCLLSGSGQDVNPFCRRVAAVTLLYAGRPTASDAREFDPAKIAGRVRQDVDGRLGWFGRYGTDTPRLPELRTPGRAVHLYWQYAPGAWADALAETRAEALALAESVRPDALPLTVPVRLRPTGDQYLNVIDTERSDVGGSYEITAPGRPEATVSWGDGGVQFDGVVTDAQPLPVNGRMWQFRTLNGQVEAVLIGSTVPVAVDGYVGMSRATLESIVERVQLADDLGDRGTWFPAAGLR